MSELQLNVNKILKKFFNKKGSLKTLCFNNEINNKVKYFIIFIIESNFCIIKSCYSI